MCGRGEYPWDASSLLRPMALTQHVGPPGSYWAAALGGDLLPATDGYALVSNPANTSPFGKSIILAYSILEVLLIRYCRDSTDETIKGTFQRSTTPWNDGNYDKNSN